MGTYLNLIPVEIQDHIRGIAKTSGLPQGEESIELIAQGWVEKKEAFESKIEELKMEEVDEFSKDSEGGALVLTYSGSLVTVGPLIQGVRTVDYTSIGLRQDVPASASKDNSSLLEDICVDESAVFADGPIKKSSAVFKIAVIVEDLSPKEEEKKLSEVTQILTQEFVDVNKTLILE